MLEGVWMIVESNLAWYQQPLFVWVIRRVIYFHSIYHIYDYITGFRNPGYYDDVLTARGLSTTTIDTGDDAAAANKILGAMRDFPSMDQGMTRQSDSDRKPQMNKAGNFHRGRNRMTM